MDQLQQIALIVFIITYTGIIFTRLPWINIDRPSAAFFGAVAMILLGVVPFDEAISAIDFNTIALLLGMMIIITCLQMDGFFLWLTNKTIKMASGRRGLLVALVMITGIGSAFLVNDAVVLIVTPITIMICQKYNLNPIPYLIAVILSSNVGSVMTMTGNPQNMLIGMNSDMTYLNFFLHLFPIALISMVIVVFVIRLLYRSEFLDKSRLEVNADNKLFRNKSMFVSVPVFIAVMILFFISHFSGISIPMIALLGASVILIFGKNKPSEIIRKVDWVLLLFFACLFIVVHAVERVGLLSGLKNFKMDEVTLAGNFALHGIGFIVSQIVSNVPYVIAMLPVIRPMESDALWLILASSSTIAGNATIIGAVANLIVIESAAKLNVKITFFQFLKVGLISTLLCMLISIGIIQLEIMMGWLK